MYQVRLREPLRADLPGTAQTVHRMRQLITEGGRTPSVIHLARRIVAGLPERSPLEVEAVHDFVQQHMRFVQDPINAEVVTDPATMVRELSEEGLTSGDCDDHVVLLGSLLEAIGYETDPLVESYRRDKVPSHVLLTVRNGSSVTHLDPTVKGKPIGTRAGRATRTYTSEALSMYSRGYAGVSHPDDKLGVQMELNGKPYHQALGDPAVAQPGNMPMNPNPQQSQAPELTTGDNVWSFLEKQAVPLATLYAQTAQTKALAKALAKMKSGAAATTLLTPAATQPETMPAPAVPGEFPWLPVTLGAAALVGLFLVFRTLK